MDGIRCTGVIDAQRVGVLGRLHQAAERAKAVSGDAVIGTARLLLGDFQLRRVEIADGSVDLIFTDPPYLQEYLPLWSDLSEFAARVLKPSGMLVAYSGSLHLPEVLRCLSESLEYWYLGSIVLPGPTSRSLIRYIWDVSKPILFFVKPGYTPHRWIANSIISQRPEKEEHDWQQSIGCARYYIEKLTDAGQLVVDPCCGAGTTGLAALELGRKFVGIDNDPAALMAATERLSAHQTNGVKSLVSGQW